LLPSSNISSLTTNTVQPEHVRVILRIRPVMDKSIHGTLEKIEQTKVILKIFFL